MANPLFADQEENKLRETPRAAMLRNLLPTRPVWPNWAIDVSCGETLPLAPHCFQRLPRPE
eukprot:4120430-Lingulodinium_polyedra.AAC.1